MDQFPNVSADLRPLPSGRACQTPLPLPVLCWCMWQILNSRLVPLSPVLCECSVSKGFKSAIIYIWVFFPFVKIMQDHWEKNKQIQQITRVRSLAQEILKLTCLLGRGSHSLAVIFYLSPQDVLLHSLSESLASCLHSHSCLG